jgi:colanic acid biosynthesis glycosyl transferase WcaI
VTTERAVMRRRLGWPEDEVIALHSGNMGEKQGLENVVEAARLADVDGRPIRFVLLGHGARRAALEALGTGVRRLEFIDPLPAGDFENALAAADVLVLNEKPGVAEMCVPSKLTSYFAAARPVVAAVEPHSGAAAEMCAAGAGWCVRSGDPAALLEAALHAAGDETAAARMGAAGRSYAHRVLSPSAALDAYEAWGRFLAASSARPGPASIPPGAAVADTGTRRGGTR